MKILKLNCDQGYLTEDFLSAYPEFDNDDYNEIYGMSDSEKVKSIRTNQKFINSIIEFGGPEKAFEPYADPDVEEVTSIIEVPDDITDFIIVESDSEFNYGFETIYYVHNGKIFEKC